MKPRLVLLATLIFAAYGCVTTTPPAAVPTEPLQGVASWYGEEFAGRTTANGEIFDPLLLTAAHRTLPFGTVVDVKNPKTGQTVRVRVNDRGPYVGNRVIDLSYAAAQQIGLIEPGIGDVEIRVVTVGKGEREPPAPFSVTIADAPTVAPTPHAAPPAAPPVTQPVTQSTTQPEVPAVVERVEVVEQRNNVPTRRQVGADGRTIETVEIETGTPVATPAAPAHTTSATALDARARATPTPRPARKSGQYIVQVGAFSVEANAKALIDNLSRIGQQAWIDRDSLYRVRIGPFPTREQAVKTRSTLETAGISAIVMAE